MAQRLYNSPVWLNDIPIEIKLSESIKDTILLKSLITGENTTYQFIDVQFKPIDYTSFENKVVLLDFWFLACPPCLAEIDGLDRLMRAYPKTEFILISFARDSRSALFEKIPELKNFRFKIIPNARLIDQVAHPHKLMISKENELVYASSQGSTADDAAERVYKKYKAILRQYIPSK
ncbi:MAG: hypothetical protein HKN09_10370 [Saprospiraceae bacterium]|nr:hypothetical protein [Saprospiraceae bacterium]